MIEKNCISSLLARLYSGENAALTVLLWRGGSPDDTGTALLPVLLLLINCTKKKNLKVMLITVLTLMKSCTRLSKVKFELTIVMLPGNEQKKNEQFCQ